jgi:hypothetical protein
MPTHSYVAYIHSMYSQVRVHTWHVAGTCSNFTHVSPPVMSTTPCSSNCSRCRVPAAVAAGAVLPASYSVLLLLSLLPPRLPPKLPLMLMLAPLYELGRVAAVEKQMMVPLPVPAAPPARAQLAVVGCGVVKA